MIFFSLNCFIQYSLFNIEHLNIEQELDEYIIQHFQTRSDLIWLPEIRKTNVLEIKKIGN